MSTISHDQVGPTHGNVEEIKQQEIGGPSSKGKAKGKGVKNITRLQEWAQLQLEKLQASVFLIFHNLSNRIAKRDYIRTYINFAAKGNQSFHSAWHTAYDGQDIFQSAQLRGELAQQFSEKVKDQLTAEQRIDLDRLVKNREILAYFSKLFHVVANKFTYRPFIEAVRSRIDELEKPGSDKVVHLKDGSTSFSIPGGYRDNGKPPQAHAITYEFKRDATGAYFFIIHNRGDGVKDVGMHGKQGFSLNGKEYRKTSVSIPVSKEQIQDKEFWKSLMQAYHVTGKQVDSHQLTDSEGKSFPSGMALAYQVINQFLGNGLKESEQEKQLVSTIKDQIQRLEGLKKELHSLEAGNFTQNTPAGQISGILQIFESFKANGLLPDDLVKDFDEKKKLIDEKKEQIKQLEKDMLASKDQLAALGYHSIQLHGSCTESNVTAAEKGMASKEIQRKLRLDSIQFLTTKVCDFCLKKNAEEIKEDMAVIQSHSQERQEKLSKKIQSS